MTPTEQRIAIAEASGWTDIHGGPPEGAVWRGIDPASPKGLMREIPDYLNDETLMLEATTALDYDEGAAFCRHLLAIPVEGRSSTLLLAEAFLRAVGKWKEGA